MLALARNDAQQTGARLQRQDDVFSHRQCKYRAFRFSIFGAKADASCDGVTRRVESDGFAFHRYAAAIGFIGAEQQPRGLGSAGTKQATKTEYLSSPKIQIQRRKYSFTAQSARLQHSFAGICCVWLFICTGCLRRWLRLQTNHFIHQVETAQRTGHVLSFENAVAQYRDTV